MFKHARRFRVVAALGLVLALAHGRAWGGETIWTKAAKLVGCIWDSPGALPPLPANEAKSILGIEWEPPQPPPSPPSIFTWEKPAELEWERTVAQMYEADGRDEAAYIQYKWLSRHHRDDKGFSDSVDRLNRKLRRQMQEKRPRFYFGPSEGIELHDPEPPLVGVEEMIDQFEEVREKEGKVVSLATKSVLLSVSPTDNSSIDDDPLGLLADIWKPRPVSLRPASLMFGVGVQSDAGLSGSVVVHEELPLWVSPRRAKSICVAPALPERKDMLPDSECSRTLIELGVLAEKNQFLQHYAGFSRGFIDSD
jgi:hypothetical protein